MTVIDYKSMGKRKILLVEDVVMNQDLACRLLQGWGMEVDVASNGREAVEKVSENSYDIVLMDIQMPEMDGVEATRVIRKMPDYVKAGLPIIAVTANTLKTDKELYISAGMNDILAKPFTEEGLFRIMGSQLGVQINSEMEKMLPNENNQPNTPLYDLTMVRSVSGGDESFVLKMVDLFLTTIPQSLVEMRQQCTAMDWIAVGKSAHKLKSTIDSLGILYLKQDIRLLEKYGRNNENVTLMPSLVDKVVDGMEACISRIKKDFKV